MIDRQHQFDLMSETSYLKRILRETTIVQVITTNGNWRNRIKLPSINSQDGEVFKILFEIKSTYGVDIEYGKKVVRLETGTQGIFENDFGQWRQTEWQGNTCQI